MTFKCVVCGNLYEDESARGIGQGTKDTDTCALCGYENSMSATAGQTNTE